MKLNKIILSLVISLSLCSCANKYSSYGTGKNIKIKSPDEIKGLSVLEIKEKLGYPSFIIVGKNCVYWNYATYRISENNLTKNHKIDKKNILVVKFDENMIVEEVKIIK
jgi:outer membrane protein assembly factor BamE (lipoprotein component of BamABCDE complex)